MEDLIKELGGKIDAFKETSVSKDDLATLKQELETLKENNVEKSVVDAFKENIDELALQVKELTEKGKSNENELVKEIKENQEAIKSIAKGDKNQEVVIKALTNRASIANNTEAIRLTDIGQLGFKRRALYDFFPKVQVGNGNHNGTIAYIDWDESTTVRAAAIVAEGDTFPEDTAKFAEYTKKLQKIGATLPVTEEFMEDEVLASSELSKFVAIDVNTVVDTKVAVGAGGANDIEGLYTASPTYTAVASGITDANIKDLVRKMRTAIVKTRGSKYAPNFVAANSDTIDRYFLKKDLNNNYMFDSETGTIAGLAIVEDNNLSDNTLVVGDGRYGTIYEKGGVVLSEGLSGTQFVGDMKTIKARVRLLFLIRNVDKTGFLKCTNITNALTTLAS
jgi:HK97 family phage major capsid protein